MRHTLSLLGSLLPDQHVATSSQREAAAPEPMTASRFSAVALQLAISSALALTTMQAQSAQAARPLAAAQQTASAAPATTGILATSSSDVERFVEMHDPSAGEAALEAHRLIVELAAIKLIVAQMRQLAQRDGDVEELLASYFQQHWIMATDAWQRMPATQAFLALQMSDALKELARERPEEMTQYREPDILKAVARIKTALPMLVQDVQRGPNRDNINADSRAAVERQR